MKLLKENILYKTYDQLKHNLPLIILRQTNRLLPLHILSAVFEIIGLFILFPVMTTIFNPESIHRNSYAHYFYKLSGLKSVEAFLVLSFGIILFIFITKNWFLHYVIKKQAKLQFELASKIVNSRFHSYLVSEYGVFQEKNIASMIRNTIQIPYEFVSFVLLPYISIITELVMLSLISLSIFIYNPILFLAMILFALPLLYAYNRFYKKKLSDISQIRSEKGDEQYKYAYQSMDSAMEIKIFNKQFYFLNQFKSVTKEFEVSTVESNVMNTFSPKIIETVAVATIFALIAFGVLLGKDVQSLGEFMIVFSIGAFRIIPSLNKITLFTNYMKGCFYVFDHLKDIKMEEDLPPVFDSDNSDSVFKNQIRIENVSFTYETKKYPVLKHIDLIINKKDKIGIIGESGSGKSTLISILLRVLKEKSGQIQLDDHIIEDSNKADWYKLISYVPQQVKMIYASVAENIAFGEKKEHIDYTKISQLMTLLRLDEFISNLPDGIHSRLGENNKSISGGQLQRIGIARALYFDKKVLIMDESTSALDMQTEEEVLNELLALEDLTIILVTHRVQSLSKFNRVVELKDGRLITIK